MTSKEKSDLAREKLEKLVKGLHDTSLKINALSQQNLVEDEAKALQELNDRLALYLTETVMMLGQEGEILLEPTLEFIDLVEHFIYEVDGISVETAL